MLISNKRLAISDDLQNHLKEKLDTAKLLDQEHIKIDQAFAQNLLDIFVIIKTELKMTKKLVQSQKAEIARLYKELNEIKPSDSKLTAKHHG